MNAKITRRAAASSAAAALAAVLALSALPGQPAAPSWRFSTPSTAPIAVSAPGGSAWDVGPAEPAPSTAAMQPPVDGGDVQDDGDEGIDPSSAWLSPNDGRVQVYAEAPSVLPGQPLRLHASTTASSFSITVSREGVAPVTVFSHAGYPGHDYRSRRTVDLAMHTVRANWPVAATISTAGWRTGVYTVFARDSLGRTSGAVFAVRDASPSTGAALFVLPVMDYQAYNAWGGSSFYSTPRAYQVSFDRPIDRNGGESYWPVYDRKILQWLQGHR